MRKLSVAPLLILIAMFLWTRFASAAESLPTTLPAKLPAKKKVASLPTKKKAVSKRTVYVIDASAGLPKTLPKKKVIVNFTQPALPPAPAVVVREDVVSLSAEDAAEVIRRRDVTEAPVLEFVGPEMQQSAIEIPDTAARTLRPALPDSDSFELPALKRAAPQAPVIAAAPVVSAPVMAAPTPPLAVAQSTASATVVEAPSVQTPIVTQAEASATAVAVEAAPAAPLAPTEPVIETAATSSSATVSATTVAPELAGPPAPPVFDAAITQTSTSTVSDYKVEPQSTTTAEKHAEVKEKTVMLVPSNEAPRRRLFIRGGYLDAAYSKLESDLKNGATLFGVSASQVFSKTEVRLGLDFAYGLDQAIALRNTRMAMFRAEGLYNLASFADTVSLYVGGAFGLADIQVTSYRAKNANGDITIRENAKGTTLLASPALGTRINIARDVSFDLTAEYLFFMGGEQVSSLGGLLAEGALGFRF